MGNIPSSWRAAMGRKRSRDEPDEAHDDDDGWRRQPRRAKRTAAPVLNHGQFDPSGARFTAHYGPGRWARYTRGAALGEGSFGRVSRYDFSAASHADLPSTPLAIKQYARVADYAGQQRAARAIADAPAIAHLLVAAHPAGGRLVMPAYRPPTPADGAWNVWRSARDATDELRRAGYAYFDLKLANLLVAPDGRVVLGDIDGLRAPGEPMRRVLSTYSYIGHSGQLAVDDHNVNLAEGLSTHYALVQLALMLLNKGGYYVGGDAPLLHVASSRYTVSTLMQRLDADLSRALPVAGPEWAALLNVHGHGHNILRLEGNQWDLARLSGLEVRSRVARMCGMLQYWDPAGELPEAAQWAERLRGFGCAWARR